MKNSSNINWRKTFRAVTFAALVLFLSVSTNVHAADKAKSVPVEIKYLGSIDDKPVFQIDFDNQNSEEMLLTLKDDSGNIIYTELVKDKKYSRKIQLESADLSDLKMILVLSNKKAYQSQTFQISRNTHIIEHVKVEKL